jgi:uncharacterized protein (TIGR02147 family)
MVIKGQRLPSRTMVNRLAHDLGFNKDERRYFESLIRVEQAKRRGDDIREAYREVEAINPRLQGEVSLSRFAFGYVSEWYFLVIRCLVDSKSFVEDPDWIVQRLRNKVTVAQAKMAIAVMLKGGLLRRGEGGRLELAAPYIKTSQDIPERSIKMHHAQMLARAQEALYEQPVTQREITSVVLNLDERNFEDAKRMIRKFRDQFHKRFEGKGSDGIYQLNLQFFSHSTRVGEAMK